MIKGFIHSLRICWNRALLSMSDTIIGNDGTHESYKAQ
jgi:hypothetical protein